MKIQHLLYIPVLALAACNFGSVPKKSPGDFFMDTVAYTYQTVHERAADCGNKADSACTVAKIKYPVFKGQDALNDTVKRKLLMQFAMDGKADTGMSTMVAKFLKSYTADKKRNPRREMFYTLDSYVKVLNQDMAIIAMEYGGYTYTGGAHGSTFTGFINWNPKTKKELTLQSELIAGYTDKLTKIADTIFRKEEQLKDTSSLKQDYFFKGDKFALNENYLFTQLGIKFLYNQYEIKPYAAGQTELFIPWEKLKTLIRPNAVVAQYIKKDAGI